MGSGEVQVDCDPVTQRYVKGLYRGGSPIHQEVLERCGIVVEEVAQQSEVAVEQEVQVINQ